MKLLVACECSGVVRDAFRAVGVNAWSCDIKPGVGPHHIQGDCLDVMTWGWDGMVAHPPCTRLANSGFHWMARRNLYDETVEAAWFFEQLRNAPIPRIAIENSLPHGDAVKLLGTFDQLVRPYWFGDEGNKATCWWLKGFPPLIATIYAKRVDVIIGMGGGKERAANRAVFGRGMAAAMAHQWTTP